MCTNAIQVCMDGLFKAQAYETVGNIVKLIELTNKIRGAMRQETSLLVIGRTNHNVSFDAASGPPRTV